MTKILVAVALGLTLASGLLAAKAGPEVLIVSDVLPGVPESVRPEPGKPVYYVILGGMERGIGDAIAGEPSPDPAVLRKELVAALASQGFIETKVGGPHPSVALLFSWGTANLSTAEILDSDPTTGETSSSIVAFNASEISQLVGANKANRHLMMSSEADQINDAARSDRVYVFVGALDADALARKQKKLLWRTRVSIESLRHSLPDSVRVMLASAAPYFGRDTDRPVFLDDTDRRKVEVKIGEPTVVKTDVPLRAPAPPPASSAPRK